MAIHYANVFTRWLSVFVGALGALIGGIGVYEIALVGESRQGLVANPRPIQVVASASEPRPAQSAVRGRHGARAVLGAAAARSGP